MLSFKIRASFQLYPPHSIMLLPELLGIDASCLTHEVFRNGWMEVGKTYEAVATLNIFRDTLQSEGSYLLPPVCRNRKNEQIKHYPSDGCCAGFWKVRCGKRYNRTTHLAAAALFCLLTLKGGENNTSHITLSGIPIRFSATLLHFSLTFPLFLQLKWTVIQHVRHIGILRENDERTWLMKPKPIWISFSFIVCCRHRLTDAFWTSLVISVWVTLDLNSTFNFKCLSYS